MNLLIFDKEYETSHEDYIQPLTQNIKNFYAEVKTCLYEAIELFGEKPFDIVLIDFTTIEGKTFLDTILESNPKQKIITLGYELSSSTSSCEECQKNYNKRRLMKPVNPVDIYKTINDFDAISCSYLNYFNSPKLLLKEFIEHYDCFEYCQDENRIFHNEIGHDYLIKEFVDMIEELKKYDIAYEVEDNYCIKIN